MGESHSPQSVKGVGSAVTKWVHEADKSRIRESYELAREYEDILGLSDGPKGKARTRRAIEEKCPYRQREHRQCEHRLPPGGETSLP